MLWIFVAFSFAFGVYSLVKRSTLWMTVSTLLFAPFAVYLMLLPGFRWSILALAAQVSSIYLIKKRKFGIAALFFIPSVILSVLLLILVFKQW